MSDEALEEATIIDAWAGTGAAGVLAAAGLLAISLVGRSECGGARADAAQLESERRAVLSGIRSRVELHLRCAARRAAFAFSARRTNRCRAFCRTVSALGHHGGA